MRASIVIVSYNSRAFLGACLDSVLAQLTPEDEVIVVDNASTDDSTALVQSSYPQARLIRSANDGYAGGNNRGAAVAQGDYLVFLNPDTVLEEGALDALIAPLSTTPEIGLTTARIVHANQPDTINACGNTLHYTGLTYCRGAGRPRREYARSCEVDAVSGAAFAIRRSVFERLGGFDERFFMYVEDTDLSLRARLAGFHCWYVAEAIVRHDYRPSYTPTKAFYLDRNRHLMLLSHVSAGAYRRLLPGLLLGEVVTWGFLLLKGPRFWGVKPRVYRWLWRARGTQRARSNAQPDVAALLATSTHRLEFGQLAGRVLARAAELVFHPAFWLFRLALSINIPSPAYHEPHS